MGFLKFFLPKDKIFYSLFEEVGVNLNSMSDQFVTLVNEANFNKRASIIREMEALEHANDDLTQTIFNELGRNFITPFDREDIHSLATALDDIADNMYKTGKRINFYKIEPTEDTGIQKSADVVLQSVMAVTAAVQELRNLKNTAKIVKCVAKIKSFESAADDLFDISIERLFESDVDAKELIKRREIYQTLELITDKCEDAAIVIESIVIKYA